MTASPSAAARAVRTELTVALDAARTAREHAERDLRLATVVRGRAAEALERTARNPLVDESARSALRGDYAAADRVVAARRAELERAREFERAAVVVTGAFETEAASAGPLAAALLELVGAARTGATRGRAALASARRATPAVRPRGSRPLSA